jgi:hypothetical protein
MGAAMKTVFQDPDVIPNFFTDDYAQTTDGTTIDREGFEKHVRHIAGLVKSIDFEVLDAIQQGDTIAHRHLVHLVFPNEKKATTEVFLFGNISDGRLRRVHELTRSLDEDEKLQKLASETG